MATGYVALPQLIGNDPIAVQYGSADAFAPPIGSEGCFTKEGFRLQRKAWLLLVAKLLLSGALLALVLAKVDTRLILRTLRSADPWLLLLWFASIPIANWLAAWRWRILAPSLSFATALKYTWIGVFYGQILPGSIAGDIAKGVSLALRDNKARTGLAASILTDKVIGLAVLILIFDIACLTIYIPHGAQSPQIRRLALIALSVSFLAMIAGAVTALIALRNKDEAFEFTSGPAGRAASHGLAAVRYYAGQPARLIKAFGISVAVHGVYIAGTYVSFHAIGIDAGLVFAAIVYPVLQVILLVPISVSGIGVRDATLAVLFVLYGLPPESGVALSWLALLATVPNLLIGGAIQLWEMYRRR